VESDDRQSFHPPKPPRALQHPHSTSFAMSDITEELLDVIRAGMRGIQPPKHYDKVYREECMYSFDTPESRGGLFVNLHTYQVCQGSYGTGGPQRPIPGRGACRFMHHRAAKAALHIEPGTPLSACAAVREGSSGHGCRSSWEVVGSVGWIAKRYLQCA
jgi:hypothetical protein